MKKKKIIAAVTGLLLVCAMALITTCEMEVAAEVTPVPFMEPYISTQPASASYFLSQYTTAPTLSVETAGWEADDGELTYRWFTFADIAAYLNNQADEVSGGVSSTATSSAYTPTLTAADGKKYYFYATVTNTNPLATDKKSGTVMSRVAVISFNADGSPAIPVITQQPSGARAQFGRSLNPLSVRVAASGIDGTLSYQWYSVDLDADGNLIMENGELKGTPIAGETSPSFLPDASHTPQLGKYYFYIAVTHTAADGASVTEKSIPAVIEVLPGVRATAPDITSQPQAGLYFGGEAVSPLTVTAESTDFGTISYQWYWNATASTTGGTQINGATSASYTPEVTEGQSRYYYVVVTNTNNNVTEEKTATAATRPVNVRRSTAASGLTENATITIGSLDDSNKFNYVRGYGGMEVAWANFPETMPADTELMYDPNRLGYNMLRIMLPVSNTNVDVAMDDLVNVTRRRPHYYDNVKIVNKYGGYVAAAPWSPPKEWKSNNSINGGGYLRHEYYDQYAAYLKSFAQHMYNRGAPIYAISIQNEPNYTAGYDGCEWENNEMRDFFRRVGIFTEGVKGYGGGRETPRVLTMNGESANNPNINWPAVDDPVAYAAIDVFSRHVYGERRKNFWGSAPAAGQNVFTGNAAWSAADARPHVQQRDGKEVWMMEHNINSANATAYPNDSTWNYIWRYMNDVDLVMRLNNENAFVWWASKRFYSMVGDGQYGTPEGVALPRGWGLSHYAKYTIDSTRIGFTMTGTTFDGTAIDYTKMDDGTGRDADANKIVNGSAGDMDNVTARITAYVSRDGREISMVMWTPTLNTGSEGFDLGTIKIDMPEGFEIGGATAIQSFAQSATANVYQEPYDVPVSADRRSAYVTLPRSRIISVKFTKR